MRSTFPATPANSYNVHADGSIRCPRAFHSVLPDPGEHVEVHARTLIAGDQVTQLPAETIHRAVHDALTAAGIEPVALEVLVFPREHDCQALIDAAAAPHDPDVHVDWHMLPDEWRQLQAVLTGALEPADSTYIQHLKTSGALQ
jgi:hypothetical protein